MLEHFSMTICT